nr:pilus assembly PilX N-terminal domain-containing protein [Candidatus Omnitrophota bacterium]
MRNQTACRGIFNKGISLIAVVIVMMIVATLALLVASTISTGSRSAAIDMQAQRAFYVAEAGIQRALFELSKGGGTWTGWSGTDPKTKQETFTGCGDYDISIASPIGSTPTITSTGYVPSRTATNHTVRVTYLTVTKTNIFGSYAAFGGGSGGGSSIGASLIGNSYTDSYDSSIGLYNVNGNIGLNGDIGTNADISVGGTANIGGDAITGSSGTFSDQSHVSGSIAHDANVTFAPVVVPASLTVLASEGTISSTVTPITGDHKYVAFTPKNKDTITITGPANIYITGSTSMNVKNGGAITVSSSSTGPVVIYFDGDLDIKGDVNNLTYIPSNLQMYGSNSASQEISITSQSDMYAAVYAPKGALVFHGQGQLYGSFIGDTMGMWGGSALHHDGDLATESDLPSFIPGIFRPGNWKEIY